ncbi:hypothetical protein J2X53_002382 [Pseudorhodobacter sp. 4114]|nr:hypothetical protein [Pseudorhodobacter sp. 4114]
MAALLPLLVAIVAGLAQGLPVPTIPEQGIITLMRNDVIHHRRGRAAHCAVRMTGQEGFARFLPFVVIAALAGTWALGVMPCIAGAVSGDLTGAQGTMRHQLATGT